MKDDLGGTMMTTCLGLIGKTYNDLIDDSSEDKIAKGTKMSVIKKKTEIWKLQKLFKSSST